MDKKLRFEHTILILAALGGLPALGCVMALLWAGDFALEIRWAIAFGLASLWAGSVLMLRNRVIRPLQTIANLLAALREEDFSTRANGACANDALGEVYLEINTLSHILQEHRLGAMEATALLRTVMEEIEVAVFTFDHQQKLKLVNRAGQQLLAQPAERLMDRTAADLELADCLEGEAARVLQVTFPCGPGRWGMRRSLFRQGGFPHQLLVISDLSRTLREEERQAWQRLVRVLGHEINNSLTPIKSISGSLGDLMCKEPLPSDWKEDMGRGLGVIASRADALGRFMTAYTQLAKLPQPRLQPFDLGPWLQRLAALETRLQVRVEPGPSMLLTADPDQIEQLLINLLRNAVDAALWDSAHPGQNAGQVTVGWRKAGKQVEIRVEDNGPGLANTANLFVPFFTTKPGGSGIGLVLCRQIAEAHAGQLTLENRQNANGCVARLFLPLA